MMPGTALLLLLVCWPNCAQAAGLQLPAAAKDGLDLLYQGEPDRAIAAFQKMEAAEPSEPLGYLLEADARWWEIYCEACQIRWNTIDAWSRPALPGDDADLALARKGTHLAEVEIAKHDSAEMELYAGVGWLEQARLLGLRNSRRGTARAGVNARTHFLRCLALNPEMTDADTGLGLYDYYVDTLSPIARILRVFMGIPGGTKANGVRELRVAMRSGVLTRVEAQFYLANNLRVYDHDYAASAGLLGELAERYPRNPVFQILLGDTEAKLGRSADARAHFRSAAGLSQSDLACTSRIRALAEESIGQLDREETGKSR